MAPNPCNKCGQSIYLHRLVGHLAYCDPKERNPETRSPFTVKEVNTVHRMLGHPISDAGHDHERREVAIREVLEREVTKR